MVYQGLAVSLQRLALFLVRNVLRQCKTCGFVVFVLALGYWELRLDSVYQAPGCHL